MRNNNKKLTFLNLFIQKTNPKENRHPLGKAAYTRQIIQLLIHKRLEFHHTHKISNNSNKHKAPLNYHLFMENVTYNSNIKLQKHRHKLPKVKLISILQKENPITPLVSDFIKAFLLLKDINLHKNEHRNQKPDNKNQNPANRKYKRIIYFSLAFYIDISQSIPLLANTFTSQKLNSCEYISWLSSNEKTDKALDKDPFHII